MLTLPWVVSLLRPWEELRMASRSYPEQQMVEWQKWLELAQTAGLKIGLWDWDVAAKTVTWSDETYRQMGFTRDTFSGRVEDAFARIHPEDRAGVDAAIQQVLAGGTDYAAQYRLVCPDGTICWIEAYGVAVRNHSSTRILGLGIDVTNLKKAQQSGRESEEKYLLLLNSAAEGIYGLDLEGSCTFCNPACLRLLGYQAPEDLLGKNMHAVVHHTLADGTSCPEESSQIYTAVREGEASHVEEALQWRADGTSFLATYWSFPMHKLGILVGAVVSFLDISEQRRSEQALRESEEKYRELVENATYGIYCSDRKGNFLDINRALVAMLGYSSKEELMTRNLDSDIYENPADRISILSMFETTGQVDSAEANWKRKDGKTISVRVSGGHVGGKDGQVSRFEVIVEDITQRRNLEEQLRQAQKMEVVGLLAAGISHDFNNHLSVILGNYLPRVDEAAPAPVVRLEEGSEYPKGTETILVLEDEESLREVTCECLTAGGYRVLQAGRGGWAIELARQTTEQIHLILSDVILPDMSGPSAVETVQALHPETKALFVSGYAEVLVAQELIEDGTSLLQKPVSRRHLMRTVDEILHLRIPSAEDVHSR